jgi:NUMOD4 motif
MEWRDVPRFEDKYQVSSEGDVYSKSRILPDGRMWLGRPRKFQPGRDGHLYIDLHHDAKNKERFAVHQLVMLAFRGKPE